MRHAYYLQRILIVCVQDALRNLGVTAERNGDDLFVDGGKLTVSIATAGITSEKIHCGINLTGRGTPAEANGRLSTGRNTHASSLCLHGHTPIARSFPLCSMKYVSNPN